MCKFSNLARRLKRLPLAMLLLAMAVFGWGLHYKLTLYGSGAQVQASEPAAKLLSERERDNQKIGQSVELSKPPIEPAYVPALALALTLLVMQVRSSDFEDVGEVPRADFPSMENSLFMRPPPAAPYFA
jgi:hypothetical protein